LAQWWSATPVSAYCKEQSWQDARAESMRRMRMKLSCITQPSHAKLASSCTDTQTLARMSRESSPANTSRRPCQPSPTARRPSHAKEPRSKQPASPASAHAPPRANQPPAPSALSPQPVGWPASHERPQPSSLSRSARTPTRTCTRTRTRTRTRRPSAGLHLLLPTIISMQDACTGRWVAAHVRARMAARMAGREEGGGRREEGGGRREEGGGRREEGGGRTED
jgi:hypothetical protein